MLLKSKEKKERALGVKLGLKAERCDSPKCAMIRRLINRACTARVVAANQLRNTANSFLKSKK